jgi:site-specific DNA-methyltransferase (adenine-specific)
MSNKNASSFNQVKLYQGDCLEVMRGFDSEIIDLTVTSPPYDNLRTYNDSLEWGPHIWKPVIEQLFRITKKGGVVVWVVGDATIKGSETGTSFKQALYFKECGFNLHDTMIYQKKNPLPVKAKHRYLSSFEYMFILSKGTPEHGEIIQVPTKNAGKTYRVKRNNATTKDGGGISTKDKIYTTKPTRNKENIWIIATESSKNYFGHPAIFPEKLANDHIISWSDEGDTVFDPFTGSGTTGKMAKINNRSFIGIEKDQKYIKIARDRINSSEYQLKF